MITVGEICAPGPPDGEPYAAVRESHLSVVVLLGGLAFKVKKPLRLPFLDLTARADRVRVLRAELALNRRLAPDVYLGLAGLAGLEEATGPGDAAGPDDAAGPGDAAGLGDAVVARVPAGLAGEPVLVMRRMPAARRLSTLLAAVPPPAEELGEVLDDVARQVARLHAAEPPVRDTDLAGSTARLWAAGDEQVRSFAGTILPAAELDEVTGLWREYLAGRAGLLRDREARGLVRDGHGDLLADDIFCLDDGPRILDCLEFDRALRVNDVLADVAFLAMDLRLRGAAALVPGFVDRYREYSDEHHPRSLEHHYVAYRAFVRAKVTCLRSAQGDPDAADEARALLSLAVDRLRAGRVHLVLVGGLPGSGKSTVAAALADERERSWVLLSSDAVRRDLAGGGASAGAAAFGRDHYDAAHTAATYAELLRRADLALRAGENVVLDASWTDAAHRADAAELARACSVPLTPIRCSAPVAECGRRLAVRPDAHASDADAAVLAALAARADPWPEAAAVDTVQPVEGSVAAVRAVLDGTCAP